MMLADILLAQKAVDPAVLAQCQKEERDTGVPLERILVRRGALREEVLLDALARNLRVPRVDLENVKIDPAAIKAVSARYVHHYRFMPVAWRDGALQIALAFPMAVETLDEIRFVLKQDIRPFLASERDIERAIKKHYGIGADTLDRLDEGATETSTDAPSRANDLEEAQDASVIRLVNQIFLEAYGSRATDIHLEPYKNHLRVRYRIDGMLYEAKLAGALKRFQSAVLTRIKIMADLSISEKRLPQDGRIKVVVEGQEMDLRVSTLPTPYGESVGIRLLTSRAFLDLAQLGFAEKDLVQLENYLRQPHGLIFLTGPTGSGKTTTLYAFLRRINRLDNKIITIEDPIEYEMEGITQVQVQPKIGLTFAQGLRSMLRHDPDVMMVGEVRDLETAEIAIRVALTGHLVFSTLHTNDAAAAVTRLEDIGLEPYLVSSSVQCFIAQRLVRVICPECRREEKPTPALAAEFGLSNELMNSAIFRGAGCERCKFTGFQGRTAIYEILPLTDEIRDLIANRSSAPTIRANAILQGMRTLRQCGWEKVQQGVTTPEEVIRVTLQERV